jgi:hypothetical protein
MFWWPSIEWKSSPDLKRKERWLARCEGRRNLPSSGWISWFPIWLSFFPQKESNNPATLVGRDKLVVRKVPFSWLKFKCLAAQLWQLVQWHANSTTLLTRTLRSISANRKNNYVQNIQSQPKENRKTICSGLRSSLRSFTLSDHHLNASIEIWSQMPLSALTYSKYFRNMVNKSRKTFHTQWHLAKKEYLLLPPSP